MTRLKVGTYFEVEEGFLKARHPDGSGPQKLELECWLNGC